MPVEITGVLLSERNLDDLLERVHEIVVLSTSKVVVRQSNSDEQRFLARHRPH